MPEEKLGRAWHAPSAPAAGPSASGAASGSRLPRRGRPPACVGYRTAAEGGTTTRAGEDTESELEGQSQRDSGGVGSRRRAEEAGEVLRVHTGEKLRSQAEAGPHPLPGFLQVAPQDFADLFLLVLGQCGQDAV